MVLYFSVGQKADTIKLFPSSFKDKYIVADYNFVFFDGISYA